MDSMAGERETQIAAAIRERVRHFNFTLRPISVGTVSEVSDGIVRVTGLEDVMVGEVLEFDNETLGMALNLDEDSVGAIVLGPHEGILEGSMVRALGQILSVPVGPALLGRVVDALGVPIDEKGPIRASRFRPVERVAPAIIARAPVRAPLQTGIKAVDALIPIGRGQRELIIGDRQTGKTTLAIDAILNQSESDVLCIYVAIGQRLSSVARVVDTLERFGAMKHTIVVVADASSPAALQYLAPYAGCAMAEEFMENGRDVLIVYDDLSKHAWAYRQISLLLRRPPGREAYPGDVFYLHARLLERAGHLADGWGGGTMTALPIIETQMGDLAAYIPTNVISITDGQIFLEEELFHAGVRPAINVGLSVSRVGGAAQPPALKAVAGQLRLEMAQFRELEAFAQFGTELDRSTQQALDRGARIREVLKQAPHKPATLKEQIVVLFAAVHGYLDDVPLKEVARFERELVEFVRDKHLGLSGPMAIQRELTPELEQVLHETIQEFKRKAFKVD